MNKKETIICFKLERTVEFYKLRYDVVRRIKLWSDFCIEKGVDHCTPAFVSQRYHPRPPKAATPAALTSYLNACLVVHDFETAKWLHIKERNATRVSSQFISGLINESEREAAFDRIINEIVDEIPQLPITPTIRTKPFGPCIGWPQEPYSLNPFLPIKAVDGFYPMFA